MVRFLLRIMNPVGMVLIALWMYQTHPPIWLVGVVAIVATSLVTAVDVWVTRRRRADQVDADDGRR